MIRPFSPPPSTSLFPVFLLLLPFLPPSLVSSSLSHAPLSWTSPHDPCYYVDGRPRHCLSEFINAAYGVSANASHDTGHWVLSLALGRRFEITYISLQFCQRGEPSDPISISILKSMDYGRTWRPMQHYSSDCLGDFGLPSQTVAQTRHQETEPHTLQDWAAPPSAARAPLALSDVQVGGRCKCNGHASTCRRDDTGRAVCVCEHHTAGQDCDVCEDFYCDRPWHRATPTHPNPCVACECNGHSNKCRFSMEVFQQSGRRSGGVCLKCRHHTAGRHCQYCQNGYTRDQSKLLNHRKACQPCQCHPLGAVGRWCNQTSGQCLCREGVTGLRCNRCAPGYQQGKSPLRPCIRKSTASVNVCSRSESECVSYCQPSQAKVRMNLETYCLKDFVLKVQVKAMERSGPWWQFLHLRPTRPQSLWVPDRDLGCGCPALHVGRTFLLIGAEEGERGWGPEESRLVADRSTLALQWREHWSPKLRGFRGQDKRGRCPPKHQRARHGEATKPLSGYVPPHLLAEKEPHGGDTHSVKGEDTRTTAVPHAHTRTDAEVEPTEGSPSPSGPSPSGPSPSSPAAGCSTQGPG
uniref:Netrin 5 n=1 Tax=Gasterosteus aculeatus aculeatus TaxID=481459 RepID=A0AAQ4PPT6_GASAC